MQFQPILNTIFPKLYGEACPWNPLEGLKKFLLTNAWLKNFFQDRLPPPPKQKILDRTLLEVITMKFLTTAPITFIINPPPQDNDSKGETLPSGQSLCTKTSPQDKTGSQKPHPQDIKLGNITGVFINSLTLVAFCLNK